MEGRAAAREVMALRARREWEAADRRLQEAVDQAAADAPGSALLAGLCVSLERFGLAEQAYGQALRLQPAVPAHWFNRAAVRGFLGRLEEAEQDYDRCLELAPLDGQAWLNRAELRVQTPGRNHVAGLERLLAGPLPGWQVEVPLRHALAKEYDDLGRYPESWAQLTAGARLRRAHLQYRIDTDLATVDWLIRAFADDRRPAPGHPSAEPVFILGMPRTGSTLVDRVIACHPEVLSAGELPHFGQAVVAAAQAVLGPPVPGAPGPGREALVAASARIDPAALGADYLARTRPATGTRPRFTDKMPLNYLYCPLIASALPDARIVHVVRHPMATCYGIYKVLFAQGYPFSYDLAEIADYYLGYRRLMAHWQQCLPGRILEIRYEALVGDFEAGCRSLLDALDLSWDPACLDFHRHPAPATTASAAQVRRPVYTSALGHWRHYASGLAPLRARLEAAGVDCS